MSPNAAARARQTRGRRLTWIAITLVVVVGVSLAIAARGGKGTPPPRSSASAALVGTVTSIRDTVFAQVGAGTASPLPKPIDAPPLTAAGKPLVVYIGAEYCPYCAAERWAMVIALSRFGSFSGLGVTHSSTVDVFPGTNTFSFYGSTYTSRYLSFQGVELNTNELAGSGGYKTLETPTPAQQQLIATYDAPPYVSSGSSGSIPFVDFGGKYVISGATYNAGVLQGKSMDEIAAALSDPTSAISQGAVGAANTMTAAICNLTNGQPAAACRTPAIASIQSQLR